MTTPVATLWTKQGSENTIAMLSRSYKPDGTRKGVIVTHGYNVTASAFLQAGSFWTPVANLANGGYPCLCVDEGGASTWGNDASATAITADVAVLQAAPYSAKTGKVLLYGGSMGALAALNWARANIASVAAMFLTIPVLDLNDAYTNNKDGTQSAIGTAYGVTFPTALPNLSTHSPVAYSAPDLAALAAIPIQLWGSDNDPVASNTASCQTWAATVGSNVTVSSLGSVGHAASTLDPFALVQWMDANGGRA